MREMRDYHDLKKAVRLAYLYVQSHKPTTTGQTHMKTAGNRQLAPDPIGEVNTLLSDYQQLLAAYNGALAQIAALTAAAGNQTDEASPDLQAAIDAANAFVTANPPPTAPTPTPAPATSPTPSGGA